VLHRRLRALGYQTFDAPDAKAAVAALREAPAIDLLLTDLVMPGIDGRTLAAKLVAERPRLKVVYTSGYSEHAVVNQAAHLPSAHFIEKPFNVEQLASVVRRALESAS
jgi:two-component system cell cycle sensor histidine kinase/response regulator CckA